VHTELEKDPTMLQWFWELKITHKAINKWDRRQIQ